LDQADPDPGIRREIVSKLVSRADKVIGVKTVVGELIGKKGRKNDARFFSLGHDY